MADTNTVLQLLELFPPLGNISNEALAEVLEQSERKRFDSGVTLFDEGQRCSIFPLVLAGSIRVVKRAARGRELLLYRVKPGESCVLTSSCLLGRVSFAAAGVTETRVELLAMPGDLFRRLVREEEVFQRYLFELISMRVGELMEVIHEVAFRKLDERLAGLLLNHPRSVRRTHQALADELGTTREMVSRVLGQFEDKGWIALGREEIELLDRRALGDLTNKLG
jgi:CRP/FNR family transcriptional regulator